MDVRKRFAQNLIEQRDKRGLTPEELADAAAISLDNLAAIEAGEEQPELETLAKLAGSLGMTIEDLAGVTWEPGEGFKASDPR
jgi:transcriptional regulator with XRE-family HTH domain